jgi:hypothetical protein
MKQILALLTATTIALSLAALSVSAPPAGAVSETLPDLGMAQPQDLSIEKTSDGRRLLRFSSVVVNVGPGKFEAYGTRPDTDSLEMAVHQIIYNGEDYVRDVSTSARMFFAGDGHLHWHVRDLEDFELVRLDNGSKLDTQAKHGFCFYDNYKVNWKTVPGAPAAPFSTHCGGPSDLEVTMGLSPGWGDIYHYSLPDQYMDITGQRPGRYQLKAIADENKWFLEENEQNNSSWVEIQLTQHSVRVVASGPQP